MLNENRVVEAVCRHLIAMGYVIEQQCSTRDRGIDIIAAKDGRRLVVEAKGGTSSFSESNRYGKEDTLSQVYDRVSKGIYACMCLVAERTEDDVVLAVPRTPAFERYLAPVAERLRQIGIKVFFVEEDGEVRVQA